jgi:hypothetical protein
MAMNHETSDADIRKLIEFGAGIVALVLVALALMWLLFRYLAGQHAPAAAGAPAAAVQELPPAPRLQVSPATELERLRAREQAILESYGWVDRTSGVVRIPIGRAMDLVAERGGRLGAQAEPGKEKR